MPAASTANLKVQIPEIKRIVGDVGPVVDRVPEQINCDALAQALFEYDRATDNSRAPKIETSKANVAMANRIWRRAFGITDNKRRNCGDFAWTRDTARIEQVVMSARKLTGKDKGDELETNSKKTMFAQLGAVLRGLQHAQRVSRRYVVVVEDLKPSGLDLERHPNVCLLHHDREPLRDQRSIDHSQWPLEQMRASS